MKATTTTTSRHADLFALALVLVAAAVMFACAMCAAGTAFAEPGSYTASAVATQEDADQGQEATSGTGQSGDATSTGNSANESAGSSSGASGNEDAQGDSGQAGSGQQVVLQEPEGDVDYDAAITLTADSATKVYDGQPLVSSEVSCEGLPEGFTVRAEVDGSQTRANANVDASTVFYTSPNRISSYTILYNGQDFTSRFTNVKTEDGELVVTQRPIVIKTGSATKPYDGTPLLGSTSTVEGTDQSIVIEGLVEGENIDLVATGERTEVGSNPNYYSMNWHNIFDSAYFEINYSTKVEYGTLTVLQGDVTLLAPSATKVYDGAPLTADGSDPDNAIQTYGSLNDDCRIINTKIEGTQTDVGSSPNVIKEFEIWDEDERKDLEEKTTTAPGTLTVTPRSVIISSAGATKVYDGTPLTKRDASDIVEAGDGFVEGQGASYEFTGTQTLIGSSPNEFSYKLNGDTKAGNYEIATTQGMLTVIAPEANELAKLIIDVQDDGKASGLGEDAHWTVTVTNPYNYERDIWLNAGDGYALTVGSGEPQGFAKFINVAPGASVAATLSRAVTEDDIQAGKAEGTVNVSIGALRMSASDDAPVAAQAPELKVERVYNFDESDPVTSGQTAEGTFTVTNTGNVTVSDISLVTDLLAGDSGQKSQQVGSLKPGETATFTLRYVVTEDDVLNGGGQLNDGYQVSGTAPNGSPVTAGNPTATLALQSASRDLGVTVTVDNAQELYRVRDNDANTVIGFTIEVTNKGNVTLNDVAVFDEVGEQSRGALSLQPADGITVELTKATIASLAPGQSKAFKAKYQIVRTDAGTSITNTATAKVSDASTAGAATAGPVEPLYTLQINYVYADGSEASAPAVDSLLEGEPYSIMFPVIDGYVTEVSGVSGNMPAQDISVDVVYTMVAPAESNDEPTTPASDDNDNANAGDNSNNNGDNGNSNGGSSNENDNDASGTSGNQSNANAGTNTASNAAVSTNGDSQGDTSGNSNAGSGNQNSTSNPSSTGGSNNTGSAAGSGSDEGDGTSNASPGGEVREAVVQTMSTTGGNAASGTTGTTGTGGAASTGTGGAASADNSDDADDDADDSGSDDADSSDQAAPADSDADSGDGSNDADDSAAAVPPAALDSDNPSPDGTIFIDEDGVPMVQSIEDDANALSSGLESGSAGTWSLVDALAAVAAVVLAAVVLVNVFGRRRIEDVQGDFESEADRFRAQTASQTRETLRRLAAVVSGVLGVGSIGGLLITQDFMRSMTLVDGFTPLFASVLLLNVILAIICLAGTDQHTDDPEDTASIYAIA